MMMPTYDVKQSLASGGDTASYAYSTKNELTTRNDMGIGSYHDPLGRWTTSSTPRLRPGSNMKASISRAAMCGPRGLTSLSSV